MKWIISTTLRCRAGAWKACDARAARAVPGRQTARRNPWRMVMIKSISLLSRREGLSHDEFVHEWVHVHAPLARAVPGLRRYVLSPVSAQPGRPDVPAHGIA